MSVGHCRKALREIWARCCSIATCVQVTVFHFHASPWWTRTIIERLVPAVSALFICVMMSRYTTIGACVHYWYYSRGVHSCRVAMCHECCAVSGNRGLFQNWKMVGVIVHLQRSNPKVYSRSLSSNEGDWASSEMQSGALQFFFQFIRSVKFLFWMW